MGVEGSVGSQSVSPGRKICSCLALSPTGLCCTASGDSLYDQSCHLDKPAPANADAGELLLGIALLIDHSGLITSLKSLLTKGRKRGDKRKYSYLSSIIISFGGGNLKRPHPGHMHWGV